MAYHATPGHVEDFELQELIAKLLGITGSPLAIWPMQETSGTTISDVSLNGYDLTASADVATWVTHTKRCPALQFDNVSRRMTRADAGDIFSFGNGVTDVAFSVFALVYASGVTPSDSAIISKNNHVASTRMWSFKYEPTGNGRVTFKMYDESVPASIDSTISFPAAPAPQMGNWIVYVGTYDGSSLETGINLYQNGDSSGQVQSITGLYVAMEQFGVDLGVGTEDSGGVFWEGNIAFAGICSKELTAVEAWEITKLLKGAMGV